MRPPRKGWCPTALKPMASGDGLIVRLRPKFGRLTANELLSIIDISENYGNGLLDFTNRANLQIRGVGEDQLTSITEALYEKSLIDDRIEKFGGRNLILAPDWLDGGQTENFAREFYDALNELPELPSKFGFSIDIGADSLLGQVSSDIRLERSNINGLVVRADGSAFGRKVSSKNAITAMFDMAKWFVKTDGFASGRMAHHLEKIHLPKSWQTTPPVGIPRNLSVDKIKVGVFLGIPFGQMTTKALRDLVDETKSKAVRLTPWRSILLEGEDFAKSGNFTFRTLNKSPALDACPGAPSCASASVETRELAVTLAHKTLKPLHVSGCAKGCARPKSAPVTVTGNNGKYDLIINGCAWDQPAKTGLSKSELLEYIERL